jgi:hypothetical protein
MRLKDYDMIKLFLSILNLHSVIQYSEQYFNAFPLINSLGPLFTQFLYFCSSSSENQIFPFCLTHEFYYTDLICCPQILLWSLL